MKLGTIWKDEKEITLSTLTTRYSNLTESPLVKFFLALLEDRTWSEKYTVNALFAGAMKLTIHNENFLAGTIVTIKATDDLTIGAVEKTIRKHLKKSQESVRPKIEVLQRQMNGLRQTLENIDRDKALAAIVEKYPEAAGAERLHVEGDLHAFTIKDRVFVVREVGTEFTGGVVQTRLSSIGWYELRDGVASNQKHGRFWFELARQYVADTLKIATGTLIWKEIFASENPIGQWSTLGKYVIKKVVFRHILGKGLTNTLVITFKDNLPAEVSEGDDPDGTFRIP